jgi:hypothetical protein
VRPFLILLGPLVTAACNPCASECAELGDVTSTVMLGTGERAFEPVTDDARVPFVAGPQGGYHVYGSLIAEGFLAGNLSDVNDACNPRVDFDVTADDGSVEDVYAELTRPLRPLPDGTLELIGDTVVLGIEGPAEADGKAATFSITVSDACGHTATDSAAMVLEFASEDN